MRRFAWFASGVVVLASFAGACATASTDPGDGLNGGDSGVLGDDSPNGDDSTTGPTDGGHHDGQGNQGDDSPAGDDSATDGDPNAVDAGPGCVTVAPSNVCGLDPQCGCNLASTCDLDPTTGNVKCANAGNAGLGHGCVTTASCARGSTCFQGVCNAYCSTPNGTCSADAGGGKCVQILDNADAAIPNMEVCTVPCDPVSATACAPSGTPATMCVIYSDGTPDCVPAGTTATGGNCATVDCVAGDVCVTIQGQANPVCKKWCRVGQNDCPANGTCNGFTPAVKIGNVSYGACP